MLTTSTRVHEDRIAAEAEGMPYPTTAPLPIRVDQVRRWEEHPVDGNTVIALVAACFVFVALFAVLKYRQRTKVDIKGPLGTGLHVEGSNDTSPPPSGVRARRITSHEGSVAAHDLTGRGVDAEDVIAQSDVELRNTYPSQVMSPKDTPLT